MVYTIVYTIFFFIKEVKLHFIVSLIFLIYNFSTLACSFKTNVNFLFYTYLIANIDYLYFILWK